MTGGSGGAVSLPSGGTESGGSGGSTEQQPLQVLLFSRTAEYRHEAIPVAIDALESVGDQRGWTVVATEDAATFDDVGLADFDVVVFLMTTGDVLSADQEAAFERFIRSGKGYVGVHSASDTEYDWPWYGQLVGAYFLGHGDIQAATVHVEAEGHPAHAEVPNPWTRTDEWYGFQTNPRDQVDVLLQVDETSFVAGAGAMGEDHPIAWCHEFDGGRSFYTALGHTAESYAESSFLAHLSRGIEWAAEEP